MLVLESKQRFITNLHVVNHNEVWVKAKCLRLNGGRKKIGTSPRKKTANYQFYDDSENNKMLLNFINSETEMFVVCRKWRELCGVSQQKIARQLKKSQSYISNLETGKIDLDLNYVQLLRNKYQLMF